MRKLIFKTVGILAAAELLVMSAFYFQDHTHGGSGWDAFLDPLLMIVLATLPLYLLLRAEERRKEKRDRLDAKLHRILGDLWNASLQTLSRDELLQKILEEVLRNSPITLQNKGAIFLEENGTLRMKASVGLKPEHTEGCAEIEPGECLCGKAFQTGELLFADRMDARHDITYPGTADHGHYCLPAKSGGRVVGMITLYVDAGHARDPLEEEFLRSVTAIIARIIEGKRTEGALFQMQKMDALNRFAAGMAHDFNNVLGAIGAFCDMALKGVPPGSPAAGDLGEIRTAVERGTALTAQLRQFSRMESGAAEVFDAGAVLARSAAMVARLAGSGVKVETRVPAEPLPVKGSPAQLEQVIMNLAANARDAMPGGGRLALEISRSDICLTGEKRECASARLRVADTGAGMPEEVLGRIFEPFFTTKGEGKGSGLGLSIVHGIVKQHGGQIFADSSPGRGTAFDIYLPLAQEKDR